jgi:hypothetical protein
MTWAEFRIRLHAYNRLDKKEWYKVREIAWNSLISFNVDAKKLPKSKEKFIPLENKRKHDPHKELRRKRIAEVQRIYAEAKKKQNG